MFTIWEQARLKKEGQTHGIPITAELDDGGGAWLRSMVNVHLTGGVQRLRFFPFPGQIDCNVLDVFIQIADDVQRLLRISIVVQPSGIGSTCIHLPGKSQPRAPVLESDPSHASLPRPHSIHLSFSISFPGIPPTVHSNPFL